MKSVFLDTNTILDLLGRRMTFYPSTASENQIDVIISRNHKDFKKSTIPVMTCEQFISTIKK